MAGMAVFAIEDASVPHVPLVHASWHCLSAFSTSLVNTLLADAEQRHPELTLDALQLPAAAPTAASSSSRSSSSSAAQDGTAAGAGGWQQRQQQCVRAASWADAPAGVVGVE
jgi:hypothetical protein